MEDGRGLTATMDDDSQTRTGGSQCEVQGFVGGKGAKQGAWRWSRRRKGKGGRGRGEGGSKSNVVRKQLLVLVGIRLSVTAISITRV